MKLPMEGRWLALIALIAVIFVGALVLAVQFVNLPTVAPLKQAAPGAGAGIGIAPRSGANGSAFLEEQELLDPDPLFLPTRHNASQLQLPALIRREPGATFQPVSARYTYTLAAADIVFPEVVPVPARPVDLLTFGQVQSPYEVLGRFSSNESALPLRGAMIEVVQADTGRVILSSALDTSDVPGQVSNSDWRPFELTAAVSDTGLVGLPVLSRGSGVEPVDIFFRSYLAKEFHLGERLPPGFYTLRVGP